MYLVPGTVLALVWYINHVWLQLKVHQLKYLH